MTVLIGMFLLGAVHRARHVGRVVVEPREARARRARSTSARARPAATSDDQRGQRRPRRSSRERAAQAGEGVASSRRPRRSSRMQQEAPGAHDAISRRTRSRTRSRSRRRRARTSADDRRSSLQTSGRPGVEQGQLRQEDGEADPARGARDRVGLPRSRCVVLLAASTLLIANTIRLSIFSRRREIEVMKLVGATNWFVRGPFMLEGLFCGLAGVARRGRAARARQASSCCRRSSATSTRPRTCTRSLRLHGADPVRPRPPHRGARVRPDGAPLPPGLTRERPAALRVA